MFAAPISMIVAVTCRRRKLSITVQKFMLRCTTALEQRIEHRARRFGRAHDAAPDPAQMMTGSRSDGTALTNAARLRPCRRTPGRAESCAALRSRRCRPSSQAPSARSCAARARPSRRTHSPFRATSSHVLLPSHVRTSCN